MSTTLSVAPTAEPLTLAEAKAHLRVDGTAEDELITSLVKAARQWLENYTHRQLITATWKLYLDGFPTVIEIPYPPLQSTAGDVGSIQYVDVNGTAQTLASSVYTVDTDSEPGRIYEAYGQSWPVTRAVRNAVIVTFDAGYGNSGADVPEPLRQAMRLCIGHWFENRESIVIGTTVASVPMAVEALAYPYRVFSF